MSANDNVSLCLALFHFLCLCVCLFVCVSWHWTCGIIPLCIIYSHASLIKVSLFFPLVNLKSQQQMFIIMNLKGEILNPSTDQIRSITISTTQLPHPIHPIISPLSHSLLNSNTITRHYQPSGYKESYQSHIKPGTKTLF